jgi:hypothetical protein
MDVGELEIRCLENVLFVSLETVDGARSRAAAIWQSSRGFPCELAVTLEYRSALAWCCTSFVNSRHPRESSELPGDFWIPACAGMTIVGQCCRWVVKTRAR